MSLPNKGMGRWRRVLNATGGVLLLGSMGYCVSLYATAEQRVSRVCAMLTPGMNFDAVTAIAAAHGMNAPSNSSTAFVVESATFGRYGCRLQFQDGLLQSSTYEFYG